MEAIKRAVICMKNLYNQKIKYIFVALFAATFTYTWIFSHKNLGGNGKLEILKIDKEFSEIIFSPKFVKELPLNRTFKIENSNISLSFYSYLPNEEVHKYFLDEITKKGWNFLGSRTYGYFGIKSLGVKSIDIYCKGRYKINIEYLNKKNSRNLNQYGFSISWSLYEDEDCLRN